MELKTILIVDDTETNIDILVELLSTEYDVLVALDAKNALEIVAEEKIDLILLDIMMPVMDGYEVCQRIKANNETKDIPIIFITAKTDEDSIEKAYEAGGIDYVSKPFKSRELLMRVKTQLKLQSLVKNLEYIASFDSMTNIYNRRKFFEKGIKKFHEAKATLYAVMIDIDKFKDVNDKYGHWVGDMVIKQIVKTVNENLSLDDIFARLGGDEFVILGHEKSKEQVTKQMERIRNILDNVEVTIGDRKTIKCSSVSNGVAYYNDDMNSLDELLKEADIALYEAKNMGRNRVVFR